MDVRKKLFHILFSREEHSLAEREAMLAKVRKDKKVLENIVNSQNERYTDLKRKIEQIEKENKRKLEEIDIYKKFFEKAGQILNKGK